MAYVPSVTDVRTLSQRVALIVADVQDDFADPAGSPSVARGAYVVRIAGGLRAEAGAGGVVPASLRDRHAGEPAAGVAVP